MKLVRNEVPALMRNLRELTSMDVLVGIPAEKSTRSSEEGSSLGNAALGYIHETGAPEAGIPSRPFLMPGVRRAQKPIAQLLKSAVRSMSDGDRAEAERAMHAAGITAVNSVRRQIQQGEGFAPLAASTLAARRRRGRTGTRPLIDTGQLRNSITYVLREDKG